MTIVSIQDSFDAGDERQSDDRRNRRRLSVSSVLILACVSACATPPVFEPPQEREASLLLEDPGKIVIFDDEDCESERPIVTGTFEVPDYANSATVFLNGWRAQYQSSDHHVARIEMEIKEVELAGNTLTWRARGFLADQDFNDDYAFCYTYTVVAWNNGLVDATVDHNEFYFNSTSLDGTEVALTILPNFYPIPPAFTSKETVAILPTGFFLQTPDGKDRHLLQAGIYLGHNESFLEKGKTYGARGMPPIVADASRFDPDFTSWEYYGLFTDNDLDNDYTIIDNYAVIYGNDITMIRPPFMLQPANDASFLSGCGVITSPGVRSEDVEITNLPFDYAVPVLSGWQLSYPCDDEHVKDIGIWLENIEYEKEPDEPAGVLRYRVNSVLRDKNSDPSHAVRHNVNILGINGREPSDLVPRLGGPGACPQISVANIGTDDAPRSSTRIQFEEDATVDVMTPPIPKGFTYKLEQVDVPPACFDNVNCNLEVTVDAEDEVTETDNSNNTATEICIG